MAGKADQNSKSTLSAKFNRAAHEAKALARQQAAVTLIGQRALTVADLSELFEETTAIVARTLRVKYCKVLELEPNGQSLLLQAGTGWKEGYVGRARVGTESDSQAGYTLLSKHPVVTPNLHKERRFKAPPLLVEHRVVSGMSVMIPGRERPFGILGAHTTRERKFNKDEINFVQAVANILAAAIERKRSEEILRQQAQVLEQIHDSVISTDLNGEVTSWNQGATRLFGYTRDEALGRHISFVYRKEQLQFLEEEIVAPLKEKGVHQVEVEMLNKKGNKFYAHLSLSLLRDASGKPVGMIGYSMDITAQVRSRRRLRESEKRYRDLTESITDLFFEMDRDFRFTYWNQTAEKLTRISAKDAIGRSLYELFPDVRGTVVEKEYLETLRTQQHRSFESRFELHGEEHVFDINVSPSRRGLSVVAKDVTERIRAAEELQRQANLLEQSHDAIIVWEFPGRIIYWNRGAEQLYGFSRQEAIGRRTHELLRTEHPMSTKEFEAIIERNGIWTGELRQMTLDDRKIQVESRQVLMREAEGRRLVLETNRDITERAQAQQAARAQTKVLVGAMKSLTMGLELGGFLDEILLAINREFKAHSSALWLYNPDTQTAALEQTAHHGQILKGDDQLSLPKALKTPPFEQGSGSDHTEREPFFYSDASKHVEQGPDVNAWMEAKGVKSILCAPLLFGEERIGYLTIHDGRRDSYTVQEKQLAQALAHQVTLALVLARLTERGQQAAILEERNRMAREIHDTLAQNLAGIALQLEVAEDDLSANPEGLGPRLARAKALAREAHAEARRSVWALRSGSLEGGDLSSALRQLCNRTVEQTGTKVEFKLHGSLRPLAPDAENHLLRIGQEAVTNALKHAEAKRICIRLRYEPERVTLEVKDDGKGFSVEESRNREGVGLSSMWERSKLIGATLRIKSSKGSGTQVIARVPTPAVSRNEVFNAPTERSLSG